MRQGGNTACRQEQQIAIRHSSLVRCVTELANLPIVEGDLQLGNLAPYTHKQVFNSLPGFAAVVQHQNAQRLLTQQTSHEVGVGHRWTPDAKKLQLAESFSPEGAGGAA
jgi:hypothetical protein